MLGRRITGRSEPVGKKERMRPQAHRSASALIGPFFSDQCSSLTTAIVLVVLVLYSHRDIKIDDFQAKVDDKVVGLNVAVSNTALVKIRDTLNEAQADLNNLAFKFLRNNVTIDGDQFWGRMAHLWNDSSQPIH
jgi:hypothetical protein